MTICKHSVTSLEKTIFLVIVFCFLVVLFLRIRLISVYTLNAGGMEQNVITSVQGLAVGDPLYTDPERENYTFTQYSPLYFHIVALTGKAARLDPNEPIEWYRLSRLFSLLFNLLLLPVAFKLLRLLQPQINKLPVLGMTLLLFIFFEQHDYSRPDSLYHLFFGLGMLFSFRILLGSNNIWDPVIAGIMATLALYSKQNGIFLLALIPLILLYQRNTRNKIPWFLLSTGIALIFLKIILLSSPPEVLVKNLYIGLINGIDLKWAVKFYLLPALPRFMIFFLTLVMMLLFWKEMKSPAARVITLSSVYYLVIALFSGLKWGSGTNYFFEFCFLTLFAMTFLFYLFESRQIPREILLKVSLGVVITMIVPQIVIIGWRDFYKNDKESYLIARETAMKIKEQKWYSADTRFVIPDRNWLPSFFYNQTLFSQPDIYKTLWDSNSSLSMLKPSQPRDTANICLITSNQKVEHYFNLNLTNYRTLMIYDRYRIQKPSSRD